LVSDVSGTISADLQVSGSALTPKISGRCRLPAGGVTVNYRKTPFRVGYVFVLTNSTIHLDDLVITDPRNNRAIANGRVDLHNALIPDIRVTVDATNFLVLNTTFRDNPLYYGTAYGTGKFSFNGPTNAMQMN